MGPGDDAPFAGTESYYAEHRPDYAPAAIDSLVDRFVVDPASRVLDLGCGAGQLTIPFARRAGAVVGIDPNPEMLSATRERAENADLQNVSLVEGSDADLRSSDGPDVGPVRLVTMGRSFHWMAQRPTLDRLRELVEPDGGVAIVTGNELLTRCPADWAGAVYDLVDGYLDDVPDRQPGDIEYEDPWDEMLTERGYVDVEVQYFDQIIEWDADRIVGYVFSLSFAPRTRFGADADAFERDVHDTLAEFDQETFLQETTTEVISGRNPGRSSG